MAKITPDNGFITLQFADDKYNFESSVRLKVVGKSEKMNLIFWVAHEFIGIN